MKTITSIALMGALISVSAVADAAVQNHHGGICRAQAPEHANRVYYPAMGIEALQGVNVACPLVTTGNKINDVEVNVRDTTRPATLCSVTATNWDGTELGNLNFTIAQGANWKSVTVPDSMKGSYVSYLVTCSLPKNQILTSINVGTP
ncbi:hypothetical protein [Sorangium sp. So ce128]|jgi:hypothetical protein|uniref:hypothetical protein n=1 Tax=Sorangium sp. So ce128 TaxID=3133281 RepID=UPI003F61359B